MDCSPEESSSATNFYYDFDRGLLKGVIATPGEGSFNEYDPANDRLTKTRQEYTSVDYEYTDTGLTSRISLSGKNYSPFVYDMTYDNFGKMVSTAVAQKTLVENTYEPENGNLLSSSYGNGASVAFTYDSYDRVIKKQWAGKSPSTITYDRRGRIYSSTDGLSGITTTLDYDLTGRLLSQRSTNGLVEQIGYGDKGRVSSLSHSLAQGSATYKTAFLYGDVSAGEHPSMLYGIALNGTKKLGYKRESKV